MMNKIGGIFVVLNILFTSLSVFFLSLSKTSDNHILYSIPGTVLIIEFLKFFLSIILLIANKTIINEGIGVINVDRIKGLIKESFPLIIPALLTGMSTNLSFVSIKFLNGYSYQGLMNARIVITAILLKFLLKKSMTLVQILSITILMFSMLLGRINFKLDNNITDMNHILGIMLILTSITGLSISNVFLENYMKKNYSRNIFLQNILYHIYGIMINIFFYFLNYLLFEKSNTKIMDIIHDFNTYTYLSIISHSIMGILILGVLKYVDNIALIFSNSGSVIFGKNKK
jgi:hypothetical protein